MTTAAQAEIDRITDHLFLDFPAVPTELALVLANGGLSAPNALAAARIYHAGLCHRIIVSGGMAVDETEDNRALLGIVDQFGQRPPRSGEPEAHYLLNILLSLDVPAHCITVEDRSRNTAENILYSIDLGLDRALSVTLVTNSVLGRRSLMTLRKHLPYPSPAVSLRSVLPVKGVGPRNWHDHAFSRKWLIGEFEKTLTYIDRGHCVDIALDEELALARSLTERPISRQMVFL
jgi:uncharacterized SAM-binding protein YcdF (DUF218 family)